MPNREQAEHDNKERYDDAVQGKIRDTLKYDGPSYCGQIARAIDKPVEETHWHLKELVAKGEIDYNCLSGRYSV